MLKTLKLSVLILIVCKAIAFQIELVHPVSMFLFLLFWGCYLLLLIIKPSKKIIQVACFFCLLFFANASIFVFGLPEIKLIFLIELILITIIFLQSVFAARAIKI
jgi:uncharacterized membrane protein